MSISLDLETAQVDRSLSQIKNSFSSLRKSAQVNMNNIRFDDGNAKNYKKSVDALNDSFGKQKQNVDDIKKRMDQMSAAGKDNTEEFKKLNAEYNRQVDELNKISHHLEIAKDRMHELNVESSKFTQMGNAMQTAGNQIQTAGQGMRNVGGNLTKWITAPILGVITAAGGMTAAFGWKRLVGVDNARAQLQGMGYDAKEVEGISDEVSDAIQGGMMTMAEGTATAAGAMAAGVERGAELEKYLKLVDAAAVGANKPVGDMAMIFNRVQGSGKLMTQELNMIEDGMPGFSNAMAEHMGVGMEEFRKMVTDGEVTSKDFLDVMDGFAGGMAEAYSGTFSGMVQNTKAWIGILGENLLGGVFEQSKGAIKEFMDLLKSDDLQTWAVETGEKLGTMFTNVVEKIKGAVTWFTSLSSEKQKLIGIISAVAVAAGPLLMVFGTLTIFAGQVITVLGGLFASLGALSGGIKTVMAGIKPFAAVFPKLAGFIGLLTGPIGLTIAAIAALGAGFVIAYNKSETFRNFITNLRGRFATAWQGAMEFKDKVIQAVSGVTAMFTGDWTGGMSILQKIGMSPERIHQIELAVLKVQRFFHDARQRINTALGAVSAFAQQTFAKIRAFWAADGQQFIQAMINAFNLAKSIIVPVIRTAFAVIVGIIKVAMPLVLGIIKMVWTNIKGVISGALNVIMGLVKVFSGIFTGDFSKMWEGVKQIFVGAIQFVWNAIQLMFYGRIIKGALSFVRLFASTLRNMWTNVVGFFRSFISSLVQNTTSSFTSLYTRVGNIFSNLARTLFNVVKRIYTNITQTFASARDTGVSIFRALYNSLVSRFNAIREIARNMANNVKDRIVGGFKSAYNGAKDWMKSLVNGVKGMLDDIGNWITRKKTAITNKATDLGVGIANAAISGFNKLIGGINKVGEMLGIDQLLNPIPKVGGGGGRRGSGGYAPARYSTGTNRHGGGPAIVGDKGPGNAGGTREIVQLPGSGGSFLFNKEALIPDMPKGAKVFSNRQTEGILGAGGAGSGTDKSSKNSWLSSAKDWVSDKTSSIVGGISGAFSNVKGFISDVWDYMKNPGELASKLVSNLNLGFDLPSTALDLAKGGVKKLTSHIGKFFGGWFDSAGGEVDGSSILGRRITAKFGKYPAAIARQLGVSDHYGLDTAHKYEKLTSPVTGRVTKVWHDKFGGNAIQIKAGELNWWFMHMQNIARKVGDMVKAGKTTLGKTGNTGLRTTGYHLHTQAMKGGIGNAFAVNPLPLLKKANSHLYGGRTLTDGLFNLHGGEYIINPNKPTEAMKLLALAGQELNGKSKQTNQLPTPGNGNNDMLQALLQIVDNQQHQIDQTTEALKLLLGIKQKSGITQQQIVDAYDEHDYHGQSIDNILRGRRGGTAFNV